MWWSLKLQMKTKMIMILKISRNLKVQMIMKTMKNMRMTVNPNLKMINRLFNRIRIVVKKLKLQSITLPRKTIRPIVPVSKIRREVQQLKHRSATQMNKSLIKVCYKMKRLKVVSHKTQVSTLWLQVPTFKVHTRPTIFPNLIVLLQGQLSLIKTNTTHQWGNRRLLRRLTQKIRQRQCLFRLNIIWQLSNKGMQGMKKMNTH